MKLKIDKSDAMFLEDILLSMLHDLPIYITPLTDAKLMDIIDSIQERLYRDV